MSRLFVLALLGSMLAIPAAAQDRPAAAANANPLSTWLRGVYMGNRNNIVKFGREDAGRKLRHASRDAAGGAHVRPATRAYRRLQLLVVFASQGREESERRHQSREAEHQSGVPEGAERRLRLLRRRLLLRSPTLLAWRSSTLPRKMGAKLTIRDSVSLMLNVAHNNEVYGSMVTYLRIKDIVPSSSEPRPAQPAR